MAKKTADELLDEAVATILKAENITQANIIEVVPSLLHPGRFYMILTDHELGLITFNVKII